MFILQYNNYERGCKESILVQTHKCPFLIMGLHGCRIVWDLICGTSWLYSSKTEKVTRGGKSAILPNWCCLLFITVLFTHPCNYVKYLTKFAHCVLGARTNSYTTTSKPQQLIHSSSSEIALYNMSLYSHSVY